MGQIDRRIFGAAVIGLLGASLSAAELTQEEAAYFETHIRPVLAERCLSCHSAEGGSLGGVSLDTAEGAAAVLIPGNPDESRLIRALRHESDIHMPPGGKLPDAAIARFEEWVKMGAPDPRGASGPAPLKTFNLQERAQFWCFQPRQDPDPPKTRRQDWASNAIDQFILARLEREGLEPAPEADRRTLIRRLSFALTGLPPTPEETAAFLNDASPRAYEALVDRLLASPHFGERWARHWMDLARYAESRGHESDGSIVNAWMYRDYLIRAFNADLPYDRLTMEHLAGDLLPDPRLHPTERYNESPIGTAFYHLGDTTHSPVDIRQNEAERLDNMIDVSTKTFLSLTVACARCHDHKFDAVSTKDYYALHTILASSRFANHDLYPVEETRAWVEQLDAVRPQLRESFLKARTAEAEAFEAYLSAAAEAVLADESARAEREAPTAEPVLFADFENEAWGAAGWTAQGEAFGAGPAQGNLEGQAGVGGFQGKRFANSFHGGLGATGALLSPSFVIEHDFINLRVGGGAYEEETGALLVVGGRVVRSAVGAGSGSLRMTTWDVSALRGQTAHLELVDWRGGKDGYILVDHIEMSARPAVNYELDGNFIAESAKKRGLDAKRLSGLAKAFARLYRLRNSEKPPKRTAHEQALYPLFERAAAASKGEQKSAPRLSDAAGEPILLADFRTGGWEGWYASGEAFGGKPSTQGGFAMRSDGTVDRFTGAGLMSVRSSRLPGAVRSPTFVVERDFISVEAMGRGAQLRVILNNFQLIRDPLYGQLDFRKLNANRPEWRRFDMSRWRGQRAYVEILHNAGEAHFVNVGRVVAHDGGWLPPAFRFDGGAAEALSAWAEGRIGAEELGVLNALLENGFLGRGAGEDGEAYGRLERQIPLAPGAASSYGLRSRLQAPGMEDGNGLNGRTHVRGRYDLLGEPVERRFLEALQEMETLAPNDKPSRSGRLEWARAVANPDNPLTARSMTNRVWSHLFGRGIVATVDNFGLLGERPTHPELLDYLASRFVEDGWSVKKLIRRIVLSSAYRMSSVRSARAVEIDPENRLLQSMRVRRLEGEAARDAVLAASGRLDRTLYGKSVPVHLTRFMNGKGRPPGGSGPLDGNGRRSLYIAVRRNFLPSMLVAFDYPTPFSTFGRRNVTNVPAQSLTFMNDPFVLGQAAHWGNEALKQTLGAEARVVWMYERAFARPPSGAELEAALSFLRRQATARGVEAGAPFEDARVWADLAHALFNSKEFIYIF